MVDLTFYMMDNVNMIKCLDNVNTEKKIKATYIKNFYPFVEVENERYYLVKKRDLILKKNEKKRN